MPDEVIESLGTSAESRWSSDPDDAPQGVDLGTAPAQFGGSSTKVVTAHTLDYAPPLHPTAFPNRPVGNRREVPATVANVRTMLDHYRIKVRYNVIKKALMIALPGPGSTVDNAANTAMTSILSLATLNGIPTLPVPAIVELLGDRNPYNPVEEWILSKPWDGKDRLPELYATLTVREGFPEKLKIVTVYKWLLSAVAAAILKSGFKGRGVLVLQGPQGIGKTTWIMALVPDSVLREMAVKVDHHMDANSKDSVLGAVTHWMVEIGELDSSFRKDFARLKGFLTSNADKVRRPYARTESEYPRRTVFAATVNDENFLVDHTGNTRWWTLPLVAINYDHGIDMQQVFAQLAVDLDQGVEWWLTKEEEAMLESCNSTHRTNSVLRDMLMEVLDLDKIGKPGCKYMSTTEVFEMLGVKSPKNGDAKELTGILRELFGPSSKVKGAQKWRIPLHQPDQDIVSL